MAQNNKNDEGIAKNNQMLMFIGSGILLANLLYYGYPAFITISGDQPSDTGINVMRFLANKAQFFNSPYITLLLALVFVGMYVWGMRRDKTSKYSPPAMMRWWLPLLVRLELHPPFEYEETKDKNGQPTKEKKRERIEGQFCVSLGLFLILIAPVFVIVFSPYTVPYVIGYILYLASACFGFAYLILGGSLIHSMNKGDFGTDDDDANNSIQESFQQYEKKEENEYSVNLRTEFKYRGKIKHGWINVINPFRATQVLGTPGSGKSYAVINEFIRQHLAKLFCMYCYDFKFPDLSTIVYNHYRWHKEEFRRVYGKEPRFCVINFDDPRKSLRCNPIKADTLREITDAYDSAYTIMINLNKTWTQKQGDFFVESPINYLTACIWYLKKVKGGKYCTLPHVVELVNSQYVDLIPMMSVFPELNNYMAAFFEAWEGGAQDQLQGQIASVRIPLSRISSPELYWVMSGDDFTLDLNNPDEPKILCVGNNPEKKDIYATALGLYNGRILKIINKKHQHKISVIVDELPTIYIKGLDNLIATARSNKVAVVLGFQDFSQLKRDYGDKEATAIINTIGNTFAGLVTGETAKTLEGQFGKNKQHTKSVSYNESGESVSISEHQDTLIPASKISTLSQGNFVGTLSDNFGQEMEEKRFNARIIIDGKVVKHEEELYQPLPTFVSFDNVAVAKDLCQTVIEFLSNPANAVASVLLEEQGLPSVADFKTKLEMQNIPVQTVIGMIFTPDYNGEKKTQLAELFADTGRRYLKVLVNHVGDIDSYVARLRQGISLGDIKAQLLTFVQKFDNELAEWQQMEKKAGSVLPAKSSVVSIIAEFRYFINNSTANNDIRIVRQNISNATASYSENIRNVFLPFARLKSQLQKIRDDRMRAVLEANSVKIRQQVKDLINEMLLDMYDNHPDLWTRRLKACKLNEKEELIRLGREVDEE